MSEDVCDICGVGDIELDDESMCEDCVVDIMKCNIFITSALKSRRSTSKISDKGYLQELLNYVMLKQKVR